jgi:phosphate/sulfate permease
MNYNLAVFLTVAGFVAGFALAGQSMSGSVLGNLVSSDMPEIPLISGILVSVTMLLALTLLRLPISLSNCVVGAFVGAALATNTQIKIAFLVEVLTSWVAAPFICGLITLFVYAIIIRIERFESLVTVIETNRIFLMIVVFFVSFTLGANNIGLILSFARNELLTELPLDAIEIAVLLAAALGMILFGKMISQLISEKIVGLSQIKTLSALLASFITTAILTSFSIPVSLTQVVIGGMLGAGVSQKPSGVNTTEIMTLISSWALITVVSIGLGFVVSILLTYVS